MFILGIAYDSQVIGKENSQESFRAPDEIPFILCPKEIRALQHIEILKNSLKNYIFDKNAHI